MAAALLLKVPTMAFEPNAMPGLANRLVGKRVLAAAVNFPAAAKYFRNVEVTGIPVRPEFFKVPAAPWQFHCSTAPAHLRRLAGRPALQCGDAENCGGAFRRGSRHDDSSSERRAQLRID